MADTIVVIAAGEMGAGIGKRLTERGARVLTSLKGRGGGSAARAKQAGMIDVEDDDALVAQADFILSVVPPGQALALAERLKAPARKGDAQSDLYRLQRHRAGKREAHRRCAGRSADPLCRWRHHRRTAERRLQPGALCFGRRRERRGAADDLRHRGRARSTGRSAWRRR